MTSPPFARGPSGETSGALREGLTSAPAVRHVLALLGRGPLEEPELLACDGALALIRFHGLEGLAVARQRESGGPEIALGPAAQAGAPGRADVLAELTPAYLRTALATTVMLESAARARASLARVGVPSLLFKGAALVAGGTYRDPGARRMDDADLLVRPADADRAAGALVAAGFAPLEPWRPDRVDWLDSAPFLDRDAPKGLAAAVDLHWRTDYRGLRFGGSHAGGREGDAESAGSFLWQDADVEGGRPRPEPHLVLVAEHLLKHLRYKVHLVAWADLVRLAAEVQSWERVVALARGRALSRALAAVLAAAREELAAPIPVAVPAAIAHPPRSGAPRRPIAVPAALRPSLLIGRNTPATGRLDGLLLRWRLMGSPGAVLRDLLHAALPPPAWLRARYGPGPLLGHRLHYAREVLGWTRGRVSPASPGGEDPGQAAVDTPRTPR